MKKRNLTPEERSLWRRATRDVAPMKAPDILAENATRFLKQKPSSARSPVGIPAPKKSAGAKSLPDPFRGGDPRADRDVRRGRTPIDAVIDLHGHTQVTARKTLLAFLINARLADKRCVLVITGKGASPSPLSNPASIGRGVLRARLGDWLKEEAFRELVVRASPAHQKHGGGGAFYVFLKRRRPAKP